MVNLVFYIIGVSYLYDYGGDILNTDGPVASQLRPRSVYRHHKMLRYTHLVLLDSSGHPSKVCPCGARWRAVMTVHGDP